ncbi:MAG: M20/M25/M40 family metallo-hydrolase [Candidatus Hodarchaeota archaeon]
MDLILGLLLGVYFLIGLAAALNPLLSWIGILLIGYFLYREMSYQPLVSKLLPHDSRNVVGCLKSTNPPEIEVILVAHMDTGRASKGKGFSTPQIEHFSSIILVFFLTSGIILLSGICFLYLLGNQNELIKLLLAITLPSIIYAGVSSLVLFSGRQFREHSVGANDNASGVAVLLECARILSQDPPESAHITFLFTGSEESGLRGVMHFLKMLPDSQTPRKFINVDSCGVGAITMIGAEGWLRTKSSDLDLRKAGKRCAKEKGIKLQETRSRGAYISDLTPILRAGYPGVTISALEKGERIPLAHSENDYLENLATNTLVDTAILLSCLVSHSRLNARSLRLDSRATVP